MAIGTVGRVAARARVGLEPRRRAATRWRGGDDTHGLDDRAQGHYSSVSDADARR